jgi:hypothetical protein
LRQIFVLLAIVSLAACEERHAYRYRLTVAVNDNGRIVSASTVRERTLIQQHFNIDGDLTFSEERGDALVLPIRGRWLVVTLDGWTPKAGEPPKFGCTGTPYSPNSFEPSNADWTRRYHPAGVDCVLDRFWRPPGDLVNLPSAPAPVPDDRLPAFVTFGGAPGLTDIQVVDVRNLDKVFGAGVALQSVTIEATGDAVSRDFEGLFPVPIPPPGSRCPWGHGPGATFSDGRLVGVYPSLEDCTPADTFRR